MKTTNLIILSESDIIISKIKIYSFSARVKFVGSGTTRDLQTNFSRQQCSVKSIVPCVVVN